LLAAQSLGVSAEQCLVIGDRDDTDGQAAKAAGMEFLHVRRIGELRPAEQRAISEEAGRGLALGNIDSGRVM
jgi:beta-phosphoglucomutase-like phosphatase (HAD superfamily)